MRQDDRRAGSAVVRARVEASKEEQMFRTALASFGLLLALLLGACDDGAEEQPPAVAPQEEAPLQEEVPEQQ